MRVVDEQLDADVAGSSSGDRIEVNAWRGSDLLAAYLPVKSFQIGWDASRQVQAQASFVFADPENVLSPRRLDDALAPFGSKLQVTWVSGNTGIRVPFGWYRIGPAVDPDESWLIRKGADGSDVLRPTGGSTIAVPANDLTQIAVDARLDAEPKPAGATCLGEVARLLEEICPVTVDALVSDETAPSTLVYSEERMDAVEDHLTRVRAVARMSGSGELEVIPDAGLDPVWEIAGGENGVLIKAANSLSAEGVYNAVVSNSTNSANEQIVGRAYNGSGPLAWGGPFGKIPIFHQSIATTQTGVNADAESILQDRIHVGQIPITVECLMHPGLQLHDRVTLQIPGTLDAIVGSVRAMTAAGADGLVSKRTTLTVMVDGDDFDALRRAA
jgi:hypothetical protein